MKTLDRLVLLTIGTGLLVNLAAIRFSEQFPKASLYAFVVLAVVATTWAIARLAAAVLQYLLFGRYAVLIYFLNRNNELLLISHPFHNRLLPPGGRLKIWELPHNAVATKLKTETAITSFQFHPGFHNPNLMITEKVEDVPRPCWVHMEHRWQRGLVKFHYVFVYVCRFPGADEPLGHVEDYEPRWMSLREIEALGKDLRPFDDIILRYKEVLDRLTSPRPSAAGG